MLESLQLAIVLAFTALWMIKFKQIVVILNFCQSVERNDNIFHVCIHFTLKSGQVNDLMHSKHQKMFEIMGYQNLVCIVHLLLQTLMALWKNIWCCGSFTNEDLNMDLINILEYMVDFLHTLIKFKMTTICSNFIVQRAVKARTIANCIDSNM